MRKNRVHGNNYGLMAGTVNGNVTVNGHHVDIDATTSEHDDDVVNEVYGDNHGLMTGTVNGGINFYG